MRAKLVPVHLNTKMNAETNNLSNSAPSCQWQEPPGKFPNRSQLTFVQWK